MSEVISSPLFCTNHPQRETSLRCNRCEKLICPQCAVLTPTGYRCKECVRGHQKIFNTATWMDYPLAFVTAGIISYIGSLITSRIGFFTLILAPVVGIAVAEAIRFIIRKRRAPGLYATALLGTLLGSLVGVIPLLIALLLSLFMPSNGLGIQYFLVLAIRALYIVLVSTSMYYRLTGTRLKI